MVIQKWLTNHLFKTHTSGLLLGLFLLGAAPSAAQTSQPQSGSATNQPASTTLVEAIRVLERERSAAEAYAIVLDTHGKKDMTRYVQGIRLYAEAKAEFDGLIEQLKFEVGEGREPKDAKFRAILEAAANKRIAFTSFVTNDILGDVQGAKPGLPSVIVVGSVLVKTLLDAGISIWKEYSAGNKERRDDIRNQLDRLKWRPFAEIAAGQTKQ